MEIKRKHIVLITKDAMPKSYLPVYGNKVWKTPNIDKLAETGLVFNNYYTCAGSTSMAFYGMLTGQNLYETDRVDYGDEKPFDGKILFEKFQKEGYKTYLIWDKTFTRFSKSHLTILNNKVEIISLNIMSSDFTIIPGNNQIEKDNNIETERALNDIFQVFANLSALDEHSFIWLHVPHIFAGKRAYSTDIEIFDQIIGYAMNFFGTESLFISADHGNMDGQRSIYGYGFDLDQPVINIPLITPSLPFLRNNKNTFLSNKNLYSILTGNPTIEDFIISDSAYYMQRLRTISIIHNGYKLIYIKELNIFKLFDVVFDPVEKHNLFDCIYWDEPRQCWQSLIYRFYYPNWEKAFIEKKLLLKKFGEIYREGNHFHEFKNKLKNNIRHYQANMKRKKKPKSFVAKLK